MKCPKCDVDLLISDRQGIEVDFCPRCRGVWLDRGELDKITERAARFVDEEREEIRRHGAERWDRDERGRHGDRRKSFWAELFD